MANHLTEDGFGLVNGVPAHYTDSRGIAITISKEGQLELRVWKPHSRGYPWEKQLDLSFEDLDRLESVIARARLKAQQIQAERMDI